MEENNGQIGCFVDLAFILAVIVIVCLVLSSTSNDKTEFIFFILVAYFVRKALRDNLPEL